MADVNEIVSKEAIKGVERLEKATKQTAKQVQALYDVSKKLDTVMKGLDLSTKNAKKNQETLSNAQKQAIKINKEKIQIRKKVLDLENKNVQSLMRAKQGLQQSTNETKKAIEVERSKTAAWKKSQKATEQSTVAINKNKRIIKLQATANVAAKGSYDKLAAQLSLNIAKYKALSSEQQKSAKGQALIKNIQKQDKALKELDKTMGRSQRNVGNYGKAFQKAFLKIGVAVAGAVALFKGLTGIVGGSIERLKKQERAEFSLAAAIKNRGETTKMTYEGLRKEATRLQSISVIGDEDILKGITAQLLTFTQITDDVFMDAQKAVMDIATTLSQTGEPAFTELKSVALQLGKALNDPIGQMGALSRSGIMFSAENKKVIKSLAASGKMAEAQALMLKEVNAQYGGQFAAMAKSTGIINQTKNMIGDLSEEFGRFLMKGIYPLVKGVQKAVSWLQKITTTSPADAIREERSEVNLLITSIVSLDEENELRNRLLEKLSNEYPNLLGNLDIETVSNEQLRQKLASVNDEYLKKIKLSVKAEEIAENERKTTEAYKEQEKAMEAVTIAYEKYVKDFDELATAEEKLAALLKVAKESKSTTDVGAVSMRGYTAAVSSSAVESENLNLIVQKYNFNTKTTQDLIAEAAKLLGEEIDIKTEIITTNEKLNTLTYDQLIALSELNEEELRSPAIMYKKLNALNKLTEEEAKNIRTLHAFPDEIRATTEARKQEINVYNKLTGSSRDYTIALTKEEKERANTLGSLTVKELENLTNAEIEKYDITKEWIEKRIELQKKAQKSKVLTSDEIAELAKIEAAKQKLLKVGYKININETRRAGTERLIEIQTQLQNEGITQKEFNELKAQNTYDTNAKILEQEIAFITKALDNKLLGDAERLGLEDQLAGKLLDSKKLFFDDALRIARENKDELLEAELLANQAAIDAAQQKANDTNAALNADLLFQKQRYAQGIIDKKEYEAIIAQLEKDKNLKIIEGDISVMQTQKDILQKQLKNSELLPEQKKKINDELVIVEENLAQLQMDLSDMVADHQIENIDKVAEKEKEAADAAEELAQLKHETQMMLANATFEFATMFGEKQMMRLEEEKAAALTIAGDSASEKARIEEEFAKKVSKVKMRQALIDKAQAIFNIGVNTWVGVTKTIATMGAIPAAPFIPWIIAQGAIAAALVAAKPIPKFEKGVKSSPKGLAEVGEKGRELGVTPTGQAFIADEKQVVNLDKGTRIFNNKETEKILNMNTEKLGYDMSELNSPTGYNTLTAFNEMYAELDSEGIIAAIGEGNDKLIDTIKRKKEFHFGSSKGTITERDGSYYRNYLNMKIKA